MPPRQRRKQQEKVEEVVEAPPVVVKQATENIEVEIPPWVPPKIMPERIHPAWVGYDRAYSGKVACRPETVHPAFAGIAHVRALPIVSPDPRSHHPAAFGYYESAKNAGVDVFDPALINPIFAHSNLEPMPSPHVDATLRFRDIPSVPINSENGIYLSETVWPTLSRALDCLIKAIKKPGSRLLGAQNQNNPDYFALILKANPRFDPIHWLGQFLKAYNPNRPPRYSVEGAAVVIQATYRGHQVRKDVRRLREIKRKAEVAEEMLRRRNRAATVVQACFRGHRVRVYLAMGRRLDGQPLIAATDRRPHGSVGSVSVSGGGGGSGAGSHRQSIFM